jgi:ankyrin repeat protein
MDRLPEPLLDRDVRFLPPPPKITDLPLVRAARSSDIEAMRVLIAAGADPSVRDERRGGVTPLVAVVLGPELPSLIEAEPRPTEQEAIPAIDFLLDHGVHPGIANDLGTTVLHAAALRNFASVVKHLAERGVDLDVADREGFTPLDYAMGRLPERLARGTAPRTEVNAAAAALRELGARGKGDAGRAGR